MQFSVGLGRNEPLSEIGDYARVAEECGFSHVTLVDMPHLSPDVSVMMTLAALNTRRIMIGHGVTSPECFHPIAIANATASIDTLSGGRAFVGLGAGGDFGYVKPASLQEVREAVQFIRKFMAGEEVEWKGAKVHSEWIKRSVPIYIAADGPKLLQLAGEIADGVISIGAHPEYVRWKMEQVEKGALKAGRDPSTIEYWVRCMIYVAQSKEAARKEVSPYPVAYGKIHKFLDTPEGAELRRRLQRSQPGLVEELISDSERVGSLYTPYGVERLDAPWAKLVTQRLIDFFHLTGRPDDISEQIHKLGQLGVKNISPVMFTVIDKKGMMREIGDKIINHFSH